MPPVSSPRGCHVSRADEVASVASERLKALDAAYGGAISELLAAGGFEGKQGQASRSLRVAAKAKHIALLGLGKEAKMAVAAEWGASPFQVRVLRA